MRFFQLLISEQLLTYPSYVTTGKQDYNNGQKFKHNTIFQTKSAMLNDKSINFVGDVVYYTANRDFDEISAFFNK
jgi:hypothetical protein